ncbi:hypothetical protein [Actinokineospora globicatena]|uniref:hypothetical protein n=1 Tax=Actinokineospora globicatena TaxID=103729 RepID=UPI0020A341B3|nr:hypothetical protein [Actinokineospora globicatena]MCP2302644.1 hypothetical protein [Actinokineospora globicatena]GLW75667.1 hypothetical protein Aglo01_01490 [Actinokineospora globicatena]GLW82508.1 hypothetical protein Aglo02_01490 [Actinokineospora globicatena]
MYLRPNPWQRLARRGLRLVVWVVLLVFLTDEVHSGTPLPVAVGVAVGATVLARVVLEWVTRGRATPRGWLPGATG